MGEGIDAAGTLHASPCPQKIQDAAGKIKDAARNRSTKKLAFEYPPSISERAFLEIEEELVVFLNLGVAGTTHTFECRPVQNTNLASAIVNYSRLLQKLRIEADAGAVDAEHLGKEFMRQRHFFLLYDANSTVSHVYFPGRSTMLSVIAETSEGEQAEIGVAGREGVAPMAPILDSATTPHRIFVQGNGNAVRVTADSLKSELQRNEHFRSLLLHYTQAFFIQVSQTALCNRLHEIEQRLARWLLLSEDRTECFSQFQGHDLGLEPLVSVLFESG
jgi:hypothetical protein